MSLKKWMDKLIGEDDDEQYETGEGVQAESDYDNSADRTSRLPSYDEEYGDERRSAPRVAKKPRFSSDDPNKVVDIHTTAKLQVVLSKPERFEDARDIADNLNEKRTVVLNLEGTGHDIARRLVDFLTGVAYANGGALKKVANNTFIITPYNVDISGDFIDELENTGMFF